MHHDPMSRLTREQQELWQRVNELWSLSLARDPEKIRSALHPRYVGWDMNRPAPHDREAAIRSVVSDTRGVTRYELVPRSIEVYDRAVGVVHYAYSAWMAPGNAARDRVTGKWSEVYLKQNGQWVMISVSGRPDQPIPETSPGAAAPG
jgi:hypothetical protein